MADVELQDLGGKGAVPVGSPADSKWKQAFLAMSCVSALLLAGVIILAVLYQEEADKDHPTVYVPATGVQFDGTEPSWAKFRSWMELHQKHYESPARMQRAYTNWAAAEALITGENAKGLPYTLGHNEFSDLSEDDFGALKGHLSREGERHRHLQSRGAPGRHLLQSAPPASLDWVAEGMVTPVKNQGTCGSCYTFAATAAVESAYAIENGVSSSKPFVNLAEEQLIQCSNDGSYSPNSGCNGGNAGSAFDYIVASHPQCNLNQMPYTLAKWSSGSPGSCSYKGPGSCSPSVSIAGYDTVLNETALLAAVAQGPVAISVDAASNMFNYYTSGVISTKNASACGTSIDHAVTLVGYGTDAGTGLDYWKIKNSWGTTWGEAGYVRMERGVGMCGIGKDPSYRPYGAVMEDPTPPSPPSPFPPPPAPPPPPASDANYANPSTGQCLSGETDISSMSSSMGVTKGRIPCAPSCKSTADCPAYTLGGAWPQCVFSVNYGSPTGSVSYCTPICGDTYCGDPWKGDCSCGAGAICDDGYCAYPSSE